MSRTQPKSSPTDEHARRIAQAIAKGRPPPFNDAFDRYCESSPREIFAAFTGAARHMPPAGQDEPLAIGYLFLLQRLLEHLRYRTDRGYADAAKLIADFQADVVAQVEAGNVDGRMLAFVGGALHQSKIPASPELAAASAKQPVDPDEDGPLPTDVHAALAGILEACDGDPFLAVGSLIESGHAMPAESPQRSGRGPGACWHPRSAWRRGSVPARSEFDCAPSGCRSACAGRRLADADRCPAADRNAQLATRERASRSRRGHTQGAGGWDRLRAMGGWQHRGNRRHRRRRRHSAGIPADIPGRTEKADIVGPDQRRDSGCLEWRAGIAPPDRDESRRRRDGYPYACRIPIISRSHRGARNGAQYRETGSAAVRPAPGRRNYRRCRLATRAHGLW